MKPKKFDSWWIVEHVNPSQGEQVIVRLASRPHDSVKGKWVSNSHELDYYVYSREYRNKRAAFRAARKLVKEFPGVSVYVGRESDHKKVIDFLCHVSSNGISKPRRNVKWSPFWNEGAPYV